jgi:signal transduction histidine kinase
MAFKEVGWHSFAGMTLHEVLSAKRDEVVLRWKEQILGKLAPETMPPLELIDHIPRFVTEIVAALRADAGLSSRGPSPDESKTAADHGAQRLRLGFSLDSVVREYGALRESIVITAKAAGADLTLRELHVLFETIVTGIAQAVTEYSRQKDADLLRQANEHFAFIAHELRDPLSAATTSFLVLQRTGQLPVGNRSVDALNRGLQRTRELIDQTLQNARVSSGIELRRQWTTLGILFEEAQLGAASEAESRVIEIRSTIETDERINLDTRLVRSALGNLVRNGVKYTSAGGVVDLRGRIADGRVVIEVEDCCGGLPPGKVEEAFAPFVRLDDRQTGFGLGLAIAKQAVDAHGGSIRVQDLPGKGCIFVLELPIAAESP